MIKKKLAFKQDARDKLFKGVTVLADAVTTTLGPKGRNVAIQRQWGLPIVVHDGVTVAREVADKDPLVALGVNLVREAASKTNEEAGDGTTTATLLAYEIIKGGLKLVEEGVNPMVLRQQMYDALPALKEKLEKLSVEVKGREQISKVAYISSADKELGDMVAEAVEKVGKDGLVTVEEGSFVHELEFTEGMEFNKGFLHPYMITSEQRMEAVIEKPVIAIVKRKLSLPREMVPMLECISKVTKDMVVIAEDVTGDALATMVANKMKGNISAVAVQAPGTGKDRDNKLIDLAVATGAKVISDERPVDFSTDTSWMGRAERVIVTKNTTVIIGGKGDETAIKKRIKALRKQKKDETVAHEKDRIEERLAKMSTGVGVIKVGAKTEIDMREKMERAKDAVGAARAAEEEGVVAGGGTVFLQMRKALELTNEGEKLLWAALESPIRKLMANSGEGNNRINSVIDRVEKSNRGLGYEVNSGKVMPLVEEGIIDPAKVIRLALENAVGVASSILTTDCLIAIVPEKGDRRPR